MNRSCSIRDDHGPADSKHSTAKIALAIAVFVLALPPSAHWDMQARIIPSDGSDGDMFGTSLSISGDTFVAGAMWDQVGAHSEAGSAYVYTRSGNIWTEQAHLFASDGQSGDWYGRDVAIDGDRLVIGAAKDDTPAGNNAGSVYAYLRGGGEWNPDGHLYAGSAAASDWFGGGLAISGDTFVAGANWWDSATEDTVGAAYVFLRIGTSWFEIAKLFAADGSVNDQFGGHVAVSGGTLLVGARRDGVGTVHAAGSAYMFVRAGDTWIQQERVVASDPDLADEFGEALALSGDTAVIAAMTNEIAPGVDAGTAYVFVRTFFETFVGEPPALVPGLR